MGAFCMSNFKKLTAIFLAVLMTAFLTGCGGDSGEQKKSNGKTIGVAMPSQSSIRWYKDGENLKKTLEGQGYTVNLEYTKDTYQTQVDQIQKMIDDNVSCLVIGAFDSTKLVDILAKAYEKKIPIISYDRLIMDTDSISYYVTFDNKDVGIQIGKYIEEKLELKSGKGPYNIEFFAGSPTDNNARVLNSGLFEVLQPYLNSGQLVVPSGKVQFDDIAIKGWSRPDAKARMAEILKTYYADGKKLDAVIAPSDGFSYVIIEALEEAGYSVGNNWPIITGDDGELRAARNIIDGKMAMTVFKDTRVLVEKCATMVDAVMNGNEPEINDVNSYNNRKLTVPAYLCKPETIDASNVQEKIIDGGYYSKEELEAK